MPPLSPQFRIWQDDTSATCVLDDWATGPSESGEVQITADGACLGWPARGRAVRISWQGGECAVESSSASLGPANTVLVLAKRPPYVAWRQLTVTVEGDGGAVVTRPFITRESGDAVAAAMLATDCWQPRRATTAPAASALHGRRDGSVTVVDVWPRPNASSTAAASRLPP